MKLDFSILLPSRTSEHIDGLIEYYNNIISSDFNYEIVIYSQQPPTITKNVRWVQEFEQNGAVVGFNTMFKHSRGNYIFIANDDKVFPSNFVDAITLLESDTFKNRKFKVTTLLSEDRNWRHYDRTQMPIAGGLCAYYDRLPIELKDPKYLLPENRFSVFWYPVLSRDTIEEHLDGHIFHPKFIHHYCDNYLPFFIGQKGEFPTLCENTHVSALPWSGSRQDTHDRDWDTFCELAVDLIRNPETTYASEKYNATIRE